MSQVLTCYDALLAQCSYLSVFLCVCMKVKRPRYSAYYTGLCRQDNSRQSVSFFTTNNWIRHGPSIKDFLRQIFGKTANYLAAIPLLKMNMPPAVRTNLCLCMHTCLYELSWMCVLSLHESGVITQWRCPWGGSRYIWPHATYPHFIVSCAWQKSCCLR